MNKLKRIAVVQDVSAFGRCSLSVAMPVLAAMGLCVCPLPTAYLSAHTGFPAEGAVRLDLSAQLAATPEHWRRLGVRMDAIYAGYLASAEQVETVLRLLDDHPAALVLIDPVLGDHGRPYRSVTPALQTAMARLAARADVLTPNLTECALLLGRPYAPDPSPDAWRELSAGLAALGAGRVVVTGVRSGDDIGAAVLDGGAPRGFYAPTVPGHWSGTGDLLASVLLGGLLRGEDTPTATERAVRFVARALEFSCAVGADPVEGVVFEPLLGALTTPL